MEAFTLLRSWRGGGITGACDAACTARTDCTSIVTSAACDFTESDTDNDDDEEDDGPFFDLEFSVQDGEEEAGREDAGGCPGDEGVDGKVDSSSCEEENEDEQYEVCDGDGGKFNFTLSSSSSSENGDASDGSPCDGLFFQGRLIPVEPGSSTDHNPNSKSHLPVALMKSATRLRVFMLGLKKSKVDQPKEMEKPERSQTSSKPLAVKFNVEEVPIISLFTRDNGSKSQKQSTAASPEEAADNSAEKIFFSKEAVQRYLKKVKPLYVRVSRRYGEKLRFSTGQISDAGKGEREKQMPVAAVGEGVKGQIPAGLREVCKHLGKSRSASAAVAASPSGFSSSRRDDSLLQQQDGIQSAILHCKRSFNASRGTHHIRATSQIK